MILAGLARVGRDVEVRHTASGQTVANMSLAFNHGMRKDGEQPTQWVEATLWGERSEKLAPYLTKGTLLCVTLSDPHIETYQKKDGTLGTKLVARVDGLEFAGGKRDAEQESRPRPSASETKPSLPGNVQEMSDDIPF
jgi:single-strand DNA-binding protein